MFRPIFKIYKQLFVLLLPQVIIHFATPGLCLENQDELRDSDNYKAVPVPISEDSLFSLSGTNWNVAVGTVSDDDSAVFSFLCGGVLINSNTVLSSASCFTYLEPTFIQDKTNQVYKIYAMAQHPKYLNGSYYNDIALLRLEEPIDIPVSDDPFKPMDPVFKKIQFYNYYLEENEAVITEWDFTYLASERVFVNPVSTLKVATVVDTKECEKQYRSYFTARSLDFDLSFPKGFDETLLCVHTDQADDCDRHKGYQVIATSLVYPNDEDSPMRCVLLGTAAHDTTTIYKLRSKDCYFNSLPALYTRISSFQNWIAYHS